LNDRQYCLYAWEGYQLLISTRHANPLIRLASVIMTLLLLVSSMPLMKSTADADRYGKINTDKVIFRVKIGDSDLWSRLDTGWVCKILEEQTVDGVLWYKVEANTPEHTNRIYTGYIRGDMLTPFTAEETAAWLAAAAQTVLEQTPEPAVPTATALVSKGSSGFAVTVLGGANLRATPGGASLAALAADTVVSVLEVPDSAAADPWYKVSYMEYTGYIAAKFLRMITAEEASALASAVPSVVKQAIGYIKITLNGTNLRATPGGKAQLQLPSGTVMGYSAAPVYALGYYWIYTSDPVSGTFGYVRSDCYKFCDASGNPIVTPSPTASAVVPTATPVPGVGYIKLIKGYVNLRSSAAGETIEVLNKNEVMPYFSITLKSGYNWYQVRSSKGTGYVRSDMAVITDENGSQATAAPTGGATASPDTSAAGYIMTTKSNVNLRKYALAGSSVLGIIALKIIVPFYGNTVQNSGYTWYYTSVGGQSGYVRGDCVRRLSDAEVEAFLSGNPLPTPTPAPTATPAPSEYIVTILNSVNLRASASKDSRAVKNVPIGTVLKFTSKTISGGLSWYITTYANSTCYVLASCARVMNKAEYAAYLATLPTPSPSPTPTPTPRPEDMSKTAITNTTNVLVRSGASLTSTMVTKLYKAGVVCALTGDTQVTDGAIWYKLKVDGVTGWIMGEFLRVLTKIEALKLEAVGNPDAPNEATYRTLTKGSVGEDVTRLQTKLQELGYLELADITGTYLTSTAEAVKRFQRDHSLVIDGIAGASTQHKLFGTVPVGTYEQTPGSTVTPVLNPVEKIDWYTGGIQSIWSPGTTAIVTDVKTGISFYARRWAGAAHADVEPLTAADTAAMCKIYGVSNAQAIADNNLYQRHPLWVTIGGRTFAASMYGVPHNYPEGDTIPDNDYNGQFCVHFVNSRTHGSNSVDADHQAAIQYAYDHAASRK
jgi:uncharacterized protein YgiM (DUF1202 family)